MKEALAAKRIENQGENDSITAGCILISPVALLSFGIANPKGVNPKNKMVCFNLSSRSFFHLDMPKTDCRFSRNQTHDDGRKEIFSLRADQALTPVSIRLENCIACEVFSAPALNITVSWLAMLIGT